MIKIQLLKINLEPAWARTIGYPEYTLRLKDGLTWEDQVEEERPVYLNPSDISSIYPCRVVDRNGKEVEAWKITMWNEVLPLYCLQNPISKMVSCRIARKKDQNK